MDYKIGNIIHVEGKDYLICEPYEEEWRCAGCSLSNNCKKIFEDSNGCRCSDVDYYKPIIFVEVGKEKESKLEYLLEVLNELKNEEKNVRDEIKELGFIAW